MEQKNFERCATHDAEIKFLRRDVDGLLAYNEKCEERHEETEKWRNNLTSIKSIVRPVGTVVLCIAICAFAIGYSLSNPLDAKKTAQSSAGLISSLMSR